MTDLWAGHLYLRLLLFLTEAGRVSVPTNWF
jgi:hypothetical protein